MTRVWALLLAIGCAEPDATPSEAPTQAAEVPGLAEAEETPVLAEAEEAPGLAEAGEAGQEPDDEAEEGPPEEVSLCATRRPELTALSLPTSFALRHEHTALGRVHVDAQGHVRFEARPALAEADRRRVSDVVERVESRGRISLRYSARGPARYARCGLQVERGEALFADALRKHLLDRGLSVSE